jgi:hypothetical protein
MAEQLQQVAWSQEPRHADADQLRELLRDHAASLAEFAFQVQEEYLRAVGDEQVPSNAQAIAPASSRARRCATRRSARPCAAQGAGLPDDYLFVRLTDGYEAGIDLAGRVST